MMLTTPLHILGISGSLRRSSFNTGLLRAAKELAPPSVRIEIADLSDIPMFNADLRAFDEPQPVSAFKDQIWQADALLIATPEYNHSIPGVLKNALDWASRPRKETPLAGKPLAVVGAGGKFGTIRAQQHLVQIASALDMYVLNHPQLFVDRAWEKFDSSGSLEDAITRQQLGAVIEALYRWTVRLKSVQLV
jgi:chromate reductase, NAD(P)H dehydrogenase (quinone)